MARPHKKKPAVNAPKKRRYLDDGRTPLQQKIIEVHERNPELSKGRIAELAGCSLPNVYKILAGIGIQPAPRKEFGRRQKKSISYTVRPCLRCGRNHKSTWEGDRICSRCKKPKAEEIYDDEYRVALDSRVVI